MRKKVCQEVQQKALQHPNAKGDTSEITEKLRIDRP